MKKIAKKRVTLEFTVDVCDGYDDFEFMKEDFMGGIKLLRKFTG